MGVLAPISSWFPEDDLLLKNAVEAGASLESLAKGVVNFSCRCTIRELQERWHSLLYDPDTSAEASAHMVELELSTSNMSSKVNRFGFSKENDWVSGKRKDKTVRSHYYAMRKRICIEPCSSIDLSFLAAPSLHNYIGNEEGCPEQLTFLNVHSVGNCILGDPTGHHFELRDTNFDMACHDIPQIVNADIAEGNIGGHSFHSGQRDSFQGGLPDRLMGRNCLYGFAKNASPVSVNEAVGNDVGPSFEHNNVHKDIPHILGESLSVFDNNLDIQEIRTPQELPVGDLFETTDLKSKPLCTFDSIHNNPETVSSGFGGNQDFSSPVSDCGASFDHLGYSSPLSVMPIWRTDEDISAPTMPMDENLGSKVEDTVVDTLPDPDDDAKKISPSGYDNVHSETLMSERQRGDGLNCSTAIPEGDFHLMTLMEGFLSMDDGKDGMDRSSPDRRCLDGFLLKSPNDVHHDDISGVSNVTNVKAPLALDTNFVIPDVDHADVISDPLHAGDKVCDSKINIPSFRSVPNPHSPERVNGVICCVLNTEDPEIPCNDDILFSTPVLPAFVSSAIEHKLETMGFSDPTVKNFTDKTKASEQALNIVNEEGETSGQSLVASRKTELRVLPDMCPNHSINDDGVKPELPESDSQPLAAGHANTAGEAPSQCRSVPVARLPIPAGGLKKEFPNAELGMHTDFNNSHDFLIERPVRASDHIMNQPENIIDGCRHEANGPETIQMHTSTHAAPGSLEMDFPEPFMNPSISDQEEQLSENEDDIPYFSDIEAMVLDMDLGLCDQDSLSSREVSRYKYEDTKRAIIRLEQGADSYMQRTLASHAAFAVLYGCCSKHYIKKPKVLLGRASCNAHVDINLGKDGCSKAISRRQAIIKMDEDGSFSFKNLGQRPVLINSKEVAKGQRHMLSSCCMIEIRGMRFLFEVNQNYVRLYLNKRIKKEP